MDYISNIQRFFCFVFLIGSGGRSSGRLLMYSTTFLLSYLRRIEVHDEVIFLLKEEDNKVH